MSDILLCGQVWFRVNEQLPIDEQKSLPDRPPELPSSNTHEGKVFNDLMSPICELEFFPV